MAKKETKETIKGALNDLKVTMGEVIGADAYSELLNQKHEKETEETVKEAEYTEQTKENLAEPKEVENCDKEDCELAPTHTPESQKIGLGCSVFEYITRSPEDLAHYLCEIIGSDENYEETVLWLKSEAKI